MHYPCPSCGYLTFDEKPGSYDICPICHWEDESLDLLLPRGSGGPNKVSLFEAQQNFLLFGVKELRLKAGVRSATNADQRDPEWYPLTDELLARFPPPELVTRLMRDIDFSRAVLYYWKEGFIFREYI